jgi:hypothetical protein
MAKAPGLKGNVNRTPPDVLFRSGIFDDPFVFGGAAGFDAGVGDERAVVGDAGVFLVTNGVLVERAHREVAVNLRNRQSILLKVECTHKSATIRRSGVGFKPRAGLGRETANRRQSVLMPRAAGSESRL